MKKSILTTTVIALLIIAALEYIIFSAHIGVFAAIIGIPVLSAVLSVAPKKSAALAYLAFGTAVSAVSGAMYGYFTDTASSLKFVIEYLQLHLPAYVMYRCIINNGLELKSTIINTTSANLAVAVADLAVIKYLHKINLTDYISDYMAEFSQNYMAVISNVDLGLEIDLNIVSKALELVSAGIVMFMPAILILSCVFMSYAAFVILKLFIANFTKHKVTAMSKMRFFSIGRSLSFFTFLLLIFTYMSDSSYFAGGVYNFALLSAFVYVINGFAVVDFLLAKHIKNNAAHKAVLIVIVIVSVVSTMFGSPISGISILFFTGLIDTNFDFRRLHKLK